MNSLIKALTRSDPLSDDLEHYLVRASMGDHLPVLRSSEVVRLRGPGADHYISSGPLISWMCPV